LTGIYPRKKGSQEKVVKKNKIAVTAMAGINGQKGSSLWPVSWSNIGHLLAGVS